jgi:transglutaminase-like putative cysteine protease
VNTSARPDPGAALGDSDVIEAGHPDIVATAERVAAGAEEPVDVARRLFEWVRDEIRYTMAPDVEGRSDWRASATLARGTGFCQQKAVLLASLLRARGIPAGMAFQDLYDHKIPDRYAAFLGDKRLEVHGLTTAYLDGEWRRMDATLPAGLCERQGYRITEFRPDGDSVLPATDLQGRPHFDVLEELGEDADLPEAIVERTLGFEFLRDPRYRDMVHRRGPGI